jgi:hypothetical protein
MHKRVFLLLANLLFVALVFAAISPAQILTDVPSCYSFAGREAVCVQDGIVHLVYYNGASIEYVRKTDESVTSHFVDNLSFDSDNKPTLNIDNNIITIYYAKSGKVMKATSTDEGNTFNIETFENAGDRLPIVRKYNDEYTSFITAYDQYSDSLYTSFAGINEWPWGSPATYWGPDVIYGPVRSNGDIWVSQTGGGTNNGWPTFWGPVYTSGQIQSFSGTPPYEMVFRGGYYEHVDSLFTDNNLLQRQIMESASYVGGTDLDANRIMFVTVNGSMFTSWVGFIVQTGVDTLLAWSNYPPGTGDPIFTNVVAHMDTIWTSGPTGTCSGLKNVVSSPLWIRGNFSGNQVWYSPFDIKLVDDITLTNTPVGESPDGINGNPVNNSDYVALVSGGQIQVQYGYKDPQDSLRYKPNCGSDADGIWIYASLYTPKPARNGNPWYDGCFTFEYQRPHPSTPDVIYSDTFYDKIDMHRRQYPQTAEHPWPGNIDLPYYNPLWPERFPTMERGTIHLYGSTYQYRRGFSHRSIIDSDYPNPNNIWDIDNGYYGGGAGYPVTDPILGFTGQGINATGATGGGVGYKKDFHDDSRIGFDTFGFNPFGLGIRIKDTNDGQNWVWRYFQSLKESVEFKSIDLNENVEAFQLNNHIISSAPPASGNYTELDIPLADNEQIRGMQITVNDHLMLNIYQSNAAGQDSLKLVKIDPVSNEISPYFSLPAQTRMNTLAKTSYGTDLLAALENNGNIRFYSSTDNGMQTHYIWNPQITEWPNMSVDLEKSKLIVLPGNGDTLNVIIAIAHTPGNYYNLYYAGGELEYTSNNDYVEPPLAVQTSIYPNPFRTELSYAVTSNRNVKATVEVYNIKGQKVKVLMGGELLSKGVSRITWDGKDLKGRRAGSGIYFIKSRIGDRTLVSKVLRII